MKLVELVELLFDYPYMDEKIETIKAEIKRLSELKEDERDRTCTEQSTLETNIKIFDRHAQQIGELKGMVEGLICQQDNIRLALFQLSREEYRFIELKYFERMKVEGILRELKRSRRSFYRLGDKVLEKLGKHLCT